MSNLNNTPPGLMKPTMTSFTPGAGNPRDSAMMAQQNMNMKQNNLNSSVGGRRRKPNWKGGNDQTNNVVAVPQFQMNYTPTGGPGTNPNDQITSLSSTGMQSAAWSVNDSKAAQMGGWKKHNGGNPDWKWGCYSGGMKCKTKNTKKRIKKNKKTKKKRNPRKKYRRTTKYYFR